MDERTGKSLTRRPVCTVLLNKLFLGGRRRGRRGGWQKRNRPLTIHLLNNMVTLEQWKGETEMVIPQPQAAGERKYLNFTRLKCSVRDSTPDHKQHGQFGFDPLAE